MSGVVDLPLVILQKAQHAAEAAAASARLLETEAGSRLAAIEGRLNGIDQRLVSAEARLSALYAGQNAHALALMPIAGTQSEHTERLEGIEKRLEGIEKRFDGIGQTLAAILAKLP
jgi:hypothetical protein